MPGTELYVVFTRPLEQLNLPYMVTGSVASIVYGEPRLTHDVDIVLDIQRPAVASFVKAFAADQFYCPPAEVVVIEAARLQRGHFNVIHLESGFKADVYLVGDDPLHKWAMQHRRSFDTEGGHLWVAPPEYVIIRKLEFYGEGGSEKHLRDIRGILEHSSDLIEQSTLQRLIRERGLAAQWERVQSRG